MASVDGAFRVDTAVISESVSETLGFFMDQDKRGKALSALRHGAFAPSGANVDPAVFGCQARDDAAAFELHPYGLTGRGAADGNSFVADGE